MIVYTVKVQNDHNYVVNDYLFDTWNSAIEAARYVENENPRLVARVHSRKVLTMEDANNLPTH